MLSFRAALKVCILMLSPTILSAEPWPNELATKAVKNAANACIQLLTQKVAIQHLKSFGFKDGRSKASMTWVEVKADGKNYVPIITVRRTRPFCDVSITAGNRANAAKFGAIVYGMLAEKGFQPFETGRSTSRLTFIKDEVQIATQGFTKNQGRIIHTAHVKMRLK